MSRGADYRSRAACWASWQVSKVFFRRGAAFKLDWNDSCLQFLNGLEVRTTWPKVAIVTRASAAPWQKMGFYVTTLAPNRNPCQRQIVSSSGITGPCVQSLLFHSDMGNKSIYS